MDQCPRCGRISTDELERCPTCGFSQNSLSGANTYKPTLAAIFMAISAVMAIMFGITLFLGDPGMMMEQGSSMINGEVAEGIFEMVLNICTIAIVSIAILESIGTYLAYKRRNRFAVLLTAFFGIFSVGILFASSVFSILAIVLILLSKDEFV